MVFKSNKESRKESLRARWDCTQQRGAALECSVGLRRGAAASGCAGVQRGMRRGAAAWGCAGVQRWAA